MDGSTLQAQALQLEALALEVQKEAELLLLSLDPNTLADAAVAGSVRACLLRCEQILHVVCDDIENVVWSLGGSSLPKASASLPASHVLPATRVHDVSSRYSRHRQASVWERQMPLGAQSGVLSASSAPASTLIASITRHGDDVRPADIAKLLQLMKSSRR
jgi:hypothetical protein